ncbi:DNA-binding HxlR family transcriptional regulator [Streptomyces luteogriseus]|uniref:DNA-binding HxlR family transcriptional regulator n=1 Tax=Streptomyces luteogriseus TaxID=68233 RepID=A0A7W7GHM7_9ACTN|nr:helix-turn-helix domain-containing protein [Streptomyces luteogriseus]MBB4711155.1 DNA-binding HxlR family transcriptional regulator [Streptomyces luteogriseus]
MTQHDGSGARSKPGRLEFERAIRRSDLPPPSRHLALTIATWADMDSGVIADRFQPSLSTLAEATGLNRATVQRHLDRLETDGWIGRDRPEQKRARVEHARTHYSLTLPPGARRTEHLGAESAQPLVAESTQGKAQSAPRARRTEHPKSPYESQESPKTSTARDSSTGDSGSKPKRKPQKTATQAGPIPGDKPHLGDVEAICAHLADVLEKTGSKRPTVTAQWRNAARLMLDKDGITPEQAIAAINWAHADGFWQAVILTPMKLREKYDQLRRQALRQQQNKPYQNPDDQSVYDEDLI